MTFPCVSLIFHGDLPMLLPQKRAARVLKYDLTRRASLKDIIESQGIPHTEVAQILLKGKELRFSHIPEDGEEVDIMPFSDEISVFTPSLLRSRPVRPLKFMVDINVRKLARNLRIIGVDTTMVPAVRLVEIGNIATSRQRILLSRNRQLLKCNTVIHGQLLRSENHAIQLQEVVKRYKLKPHIKPFTRCITCNGNLRSIAKQAVYHRLEPLTRKYFSTFKQCEDCEKVYWQGSHHEPMNKLVNQVR